jgi:alkylation response protein AidB-like acyl-CoA dehydrogenase
MNLNLTEDQKALSDLAHQILREKLPPDRLRAIEAAEHWFDESSWSELAKARLLAAGLPDDVGGGGFGFLETCLVLEQIGRTVAPLPYFETVVLGALPIDRFGSPEQRRAHLPAVADGDLILTAALLEAGEALPPLRPRTRARRDGDGWRVDGEKLFVGAAHLAGRMLVPASTADDAAAVFIVDMKAPGVSLERVQVTTFEPQANIRFEGVRVGDADVLGKPDDGAEIVRWISAHALTGLCSMQAGVCEQALRMTAEYVSQREQLGTKIATFQAVAHRAADAYIDTAAVTLTSRLAAWSLAQGLDADHLIAIAKFWAADGGQRVVHAAQHLHGGIGVDTEYPVHRYFRWAKQLELTMGGAHEHLLRLGDELAEARV